MIWLTQSDVLLWLASFRNSAFRRDAIRSVNCDKMSLSSRVDSDPEQYSFLKIVGPELHVPVVLTITARPVDGSGQIQMFVSGKENPTPMAKRNHHSFKAKSEKGEHGDRPARKKSIACGKQITVLHFHFQ